MWRIWVLEKNSTIVRHSRTPYDCLISPTTTDFRAVHDQLSESGTIKFTSRVSCCATDTLTPSGFSNLLEPPRTWMRSTAKSLERAIYWIVLLHLEIMQLLLKGYNNQVCLFWNYTEGSELAIQLLSDLHLWFTQCSIQPAEIFKIQFSFVCSKDV